MHLIGCDFSSSPSRRKAIVIASGKVQQGVVVFEALTRLESLAAFSSWLNDSDSWIGGFDLPFGLPRALIADLQWPLTWRACIQHYAALERHDIRLLFRAFCDARPVGQKFAHRTTDVPAGSSPSMKWVNPPVAWMMHAGVPRLMDAGVYFPGLDPVPVSLPLKVALEAYPGMLVRELIGGASYKSDDRSKQTPERLLMRREIIHQLEMGSWRLSLRLKLSHAQRDMLAQDPTGDSLDAVLCLMQAAWGWGKYEAGDQRFGLPSDIDPLEGWIVSA